MGQVLDLAHGAAHALLFALFAIAGIGKLSGCGRAGIIMCRKGAIDLVLAAGFCVSTPASLAAGFAGVAVLIGTGGWLREKIRSNTICNCFGLLTLTLHPLRNYARAAMVAGGAFLMATALRGDLASEGNLLARWQGAVLALALLLGAISYAFARRVLVMQGRSAADLAASERSAALVLSQADFLGRRVDGAAVQLGDFVRHERPIALLLSSRNCLACRALKNELAPLVGNLPFPFQFVVENEAQAGDGAGPFLFDPHGSFRRRVGLELLPALVLVDPVSWTVAYPVATGADDIRRDLLRLLLTSAEAAPGQAFASALAPATLAT